MCCRMNTVREIQYLQNMLFTLSTDTLFNPNPWKEIYYPLSRIPFISGSRIRSTKISALRSRRMKHEKSLDLKNNDRIILFFGYIRKYKGLDLLLEAMNIVRKSMDIHLLVAGEFYDDEQHYRDYRRNKTVLTNCVHFMSEYIPNDRVPVYIFCSRLRCASISFCNPKRYRSNCI